MEKKKLAYQVQGDTTTYYVVSVDEEQVKGIIKDITSVYGYKVMWPNNNENKLRLRNNQIVDSNYAMEINEKDPAAVMAKTETLKWRVALAKKAMTRFSGQPEERPYVEKCVDKKRTLGDSEEKLTDTGLIVDYRRKDINPMNLIHTATNKDGYVKESAEMVNVRYKMLSFPYLAQALIALLKDNSNIAPLDTAIMTELASNDIDGEEFIPRILNAVGLSEYTWSSTDKFESMIKGSLKTIDPTIDEDLSTITRREVFADSVLVSNIYKPRQKRKQR